MAELKAVELQEMSNGHTRRNRKILLAIGAVALVGGVGVVASLHHAQISNNKSMDVLRSLSQAHALKLNVQSYGNLVEYGDEQNYTIYAVPKGSSYNLWLTSLAPDGQEFNLTLKDNRGYYSFQNMLNASSDPLIHCLQPKQSMPLNEIAHSILDSTVVQDMDVEIQQGMGCEAGTVVTGVWASREFAYCIDSADKVTSLYSENLVVHIEYLSPQKAIEIETLLQPKSTTHCPELKVGQPLESRKLQTQRSLGVFRRIATSVFNKVKTHVQRNDPNYNAFAAYLSKQPFPDSITKSRFSTSSRVCLYAKGNPKAMVLNAKYSNDRKSVALTHYKQQKKLIFNGLLPVLVPYGPPTISLKVEEVHRVMFPRNCVWIHGDGYSKHSNVLHDSYYEAFGSQGLEYPCYCKKTYFVQANTEKHRWHSKELQKHLCHMVRMADEDSPLDLEINDVIINAHYSGALAFGAALANGYCSLGPKSQLITIQAPLDGLALPPPNSRAITDLCKDIVQIQNDIDVSRKRYIGRFRAAIKHFIEAFVTTVLALVSELFSDWTNLFPTLSDCRASWSDQREAIWEALRPRSEMQDPKVIEAFDAAAKALGENVNAAMCGMSETGSTNVGFSTIDTSTLFQQTGPSDKVVPLASCTKLHQYIAAYGGKRRLNEGRTEEYEYEFDTSLTSGSPFLMLDVSFTDIKINADSYSSGDFTTGLLSFGGSFADTDIDGFEA